MIEAFSEPQQFLSALEFYLARHPLERAVAQDFLDFAKADGTEAFRRENLKRHFTASAWILSPDRQQCLLTHHRKLKIWVQLGGHCDGDQNILRSAIREAEEESGMKGFELLTTEIFDIDRHIIPARLNEPEHFHYDIRFCLVALHLNFAISSESLDLQWFKKSDPIFSSDAGQSIRRMFEKWMAL